MNLILDLLGYTNHNVVRCIYNKSPLEFYANIKDEDILNQQLQVLKFAWPNITRKIFLEDVCSSTLEKRIWLNRRELILKHGLKLFIQNINVDDINYILEYSMINKSFKDINEAIAFLQSEITYPTIAVDFFPLVLKKCNPYAAGLQNNTLYYLSKAPTFKQP